MTKNSQVERGILVAVQTTEDDRTFQYSLSELEQLVHNAGIDTERVITQKRKIPDARTLIGKGKVREVSRLVDEWGIDVVIFNHELSPSHIRNLQEDIDAKIIDRIQVILDIFAMRATSREGGLQVALAQLEYLLPRLAGHGINMSRLGGGIGTRGPGETKLETDRRHIYRQIHKIKAELKKVSAHRLRNREKRTQNGTIQIGLIGYTNAGKTTILNRLTDEETQGKDILFATLDPLTRQLTLPSGLQVVLTDTVGFIQDLPTGLIEAFQSTLEESQTADLLIHVIDASAQNMFLHEDTVTQLLRQMGMSHIPVLNVYNKMDLVGDHYFSPTLYPHITVSMKKEADIVRLKQAIEDKLSEILGAYSLKVPSNRGDLLTQIKAETLVLHEEFDEAEQIYLISGRGREFLIERIESELSERKI